MALREFFPGYSGVSGNYSQEKKRSSAEGLLSWICPLDNLGHATNHLLEVMPAERIQVRHVIAVGDAGIAVMQAGQHRAVGDSARLCGLAFAALS